MEVSVDGGAVLSGVGSVEVFCFSVNVPVETEGGMNQIEGKRGMTKGDQK